jgi:hypothetical protein
MSIHPLKLRRPVASDQVSVGMVLKITDRLQSISNLVGLTNDTTGNARLAKEAMWDLVRFVNRFMESIEDEAARLRREDSK